MTTELETLMEIRDVLSHLLHIQRIVALEIIKDRASEVAKDDRALKVLQESNELRSAADVATATNIPRATVQRLWRTLSHAGLMREDPKVTGRFIPLFAPGEIRAVLGENNE